MQWFNAKTQITIYYVNHTVEFFSYLLNSTCFSVLNANIQSSSSNFENLDIFLGSLNKTVGLVCLTERFTYNDETPNFHIGGFTFVGTS